MRHGHFFRPRSATVPALQLGARRYLSLQAKEAERRADDGEAERSTSHGLQAQAARISGQLHASSEGNEGLRDARNAYIREIARRKRLQRREANAAELGDASEAVREGWAAYKVLYNDPANAAEREAMLARQRRYHRKAIENGPAKGVALPAPDVADHRVYPLNRRDAPIAHGTIAEAHRARKRATNALRSAKNAAASPEVLAALEEKYEQSCSDYQLYLRDPRNAHEAEERRERAREGRKARLEKYGEERLKAMQKIYDARHHRKQRAEQIKAE